MLDEIFDIESFNIFSDNEYYYFFRALNKDDIKDIESGITIDENGELIKVRTDLERYKDDPIYSLDDEISLEQVFNHIKMHQRKDTNCISLTSNANTAITYGRGFYKDRYALVRILKKDFNSYVYEAGLYMLKEINKRIEEMISNNELTPEQIKLIKYIDRVSTQEELNAIKELITPTTDEDQVYELGLSRITTSSNYLALNDKQNLEKDKIILKLDVLNKNLIKGSSNNILIQTIGNAFSSLELIHYGEIKNENVQEIPKEIIDILSLIQQLPEDLPNLNKLKEYVLLKISEKEKVNDYFKYSSFNIDENIFSLDNIYDLTGGKTSYNDACEMYRKAFYYAKSRLRTIYSIDLLKNIVGDNEEFKEVFDYMYKNTYGIEPEITTRMSLNKIQVSESVSLDFLLNERQMLYYLSKLNTEQLNFIIENPTESLKIIINSFIDDELDVIPQSKEDWYANSIIDSLDLRRLGVTTNLSELQRRDIINALKEKAFYEQYLLLKEKGFSNKKIANVLFNNLIKGTNNLDYEELFTLEELEYFIGYNRIKGLGLNLTSYQKDAVDNIERIYKKKRFTSAIMPTGTGKSFVALAEMHKRREEKILYLAPNVEILNQMKKYIKEIYRPEEHIGDKEDDPIKRLFPNIVFDTYQHLQEESAQELIKDEYSFIVFDELHRTGAKEWSKQVKELLDNQSEETKVLGITATPERDMDLRDMADNWAQYFGYTDEEIIKNEHIAINMDIIEAIRLGYISNPKVINCEYSLITDGTLEDIKLSVEDIQEDNMKQEVLKKYENLRRNVEKSSGIEKILKNNIEESGKYIIFIPVNKKNNGTYEDEDGNIIGKTTGERIITAYKTLMKQYLYSEEYFQKNGVILNSIYEKINNNEKLSNEELIFLNMEKENIFISSYIEIPNKPVTLETKNNQIINKIINYMNWQKLSDKELTKRINAKMRDKIEDYSMLGSYSAQKNKTNLDSFNNDTSQKTKLMFVMNKLNEGVHVKDIDGIIWLRPLDSNSRILYLQQLGRCIKANTNSDNNKVPTIIDLVNNTLKVKLEKDISVEEQDLNRLLLIKSWVLNNQKYPDVDSKDKIEKQYYIYLNTLNKKYRKYFDNVEKLKELNVTKKIIVNQILETGSEIDLWNQPIYDIGSNNEIRKEKSNIYGILEVNEHVRDFIELKQITNIDTFKQHVEEAIEWLKENKRYPISRKDEFKDGGNIFGFFRQNRLKIKEEYPILYELIKRYNPTFDTEETQADFKFKQHVEEAIEWLKENKRYPIHIKDKFKDGGDIYSFLWNNRLKIKEEYPILYELIKRYNSTFDTEETQVDFKFNQRVEEAIEWLKENKRYPIHIKDKFKDGGNIYVFFRQNRLKIKEEYPILYELIKRYNPTFDTEETRVDFKFNQRVEEAIEWLKENKRYPVSKKDKFKDGGDIYGFFRQNRLKIKEEYPILYELIKRYNPTYGCSKNEMKLLKIEEIYRRYFGTNKRLSVTIKEKFELDGKVIGYFLHTKSNYDIEGNYMAEWIMEQMDKNRRDFERDKDEFDKESEFSKAMDNERGKSK